MIGSRPITQNEISLIYSNLDTYRDKTLFILNLYTGFRIKESLSLRVLDVLNPQGEVFERITVKRSNMKNKISSRTILLHPKLRTHLKALIEIEKLTNADYLFKSKVGSNKAIERIQAWKLFNRAVRKAGIEGKVSLHSTRKTFADNMYNAFGKDLLKTSKALGHKNISSTISYLSFKTEELDEAINALDIPLAHARLGIGEK